MSKYTIYDVVTYAEDSATYNSFVSLLEADTYHGRRLNNSLWREADEDTRTSALFWATDILNRQDWKGNPVSYTQALAWPRKYVPNRLSVHRQWNKPNMFDDYDSIHRIQYLTELDVPQEIKDVTAELAQYLLARESSGKNQAASSDDQLANLTLGGLSMEFREEEDNITDMPSNVYHQVKDFLNSVTEGDPSILGAGSVRLRRG
jgi:hypothetical protein|tara:strand:+ start:114 stop:728 length:615 start_codon:yes stop_codon:yes gene_type:complete